MGDAETREKRREEKSEEKEKEKRTRRVWCRTYMTYPHMTR